MKHLKKSAKTVTESFRQSVWCKRSKSSCDKAVVKSDIATVIYTDIAAANAAVAKIPMPALSNDKAIKLASDLGKALIDRINVKDAKEIEKYEKKITDLKNDVEKAYQDSKINVEDRDAIKTYIEDCVRAAVVTVVAIHS